MKIEIKNAPSQEVDWSKGNQLVESKGLIVLTSAHTGAKGEVLFSGTVIVSGGNSARVVGEYVNCWMKMFFQPFNGEITLKND